MTFFVAVVAAPCVLRTLTATWDMEGKSVVLIRTSSIARAPIYAHLRSLGLKLIIVHPEPPLAEFDGLFNEWLQCETHNVAHLQVVLRAFLSKKKLHVDAIISFDEYGVYPAAMLAEAFQLRAIPLSARRLRQTNDKSRFRRFCERHHVSSPRSRKLSCPASVERLLYDNIHKHIHEQLIQYVTELTHGMQFPLIVKPSVGAGSLLVRQCANIDELAAHAIESWRVLSSHPDSAHFQTICLHDCDVHHDSDNPLVPPGHGRDLAHCTSSDDNNNNNNDNNQSVCDSSSPDRDDANLTLPRGAAERARKNSAPDDDDDDDERHEEQKEMERHRLSRPPLGSDVVSARTNRSIEDGDGNQSEAPEMQNRAATCTSHRVAHDGGSILDSNDHALCVPVEALHDSATRWANDDDNSDDDTVNDTPGDVSYSDHESSVASMFSSYSRIDLLVEEFIDGYEVDMDCAVEKGILRFCAISDNFAPTYPYFAEVGGLCPSRLGLQEQTALRDLLVSYVAAHGARLNGVLHFEAKYDPTRGKAYVIEVNNRLGSAETNTMIMNTYRGFQLGEALLRCALDIPIVHQLAQHFPRLVSLPPPALSLSSSSPPSTCVCHGENTRLQECTSCGGEKTAVHQASDEKLAGSVGAPNSAALSVPTTDSQRTNVAQPLERAGRLGDTSGMTRSRTHDAAGRCVEYDFAGIVDPKDLGGAHYGFFPATCVSASVNIYPPKDGELRGYRILSDNENLVTYSFAPIGTRLQATGMSVRMTGWIVARGATCKEAQDNIQFLTENFHQELV